ncbi:hypothetical protein ACH5RR_037121 [Cinchona calisaya]|uniref:Uncharacterized protein n=1 Tax=Cinchona calisaya TaxID=153742 RepID=A0ABD2Y8B9_9GENT
MEERRSENLFLSSLFASRREKKMLLFFWPFNRKNNELLCRRRKYYAEKKKDKETALKSSSLKKNQHNRSKDLDKKYVCNTGVQDIETGACFTENDATQNELPQSNNYVTLFSDKNLVEFLDYMSRELASSSANQQNQKQTSTYVPLFSDQSFPAGGQLAEEGCSFVSFSTPELSGNDTVHHALINTSIVTEGLRDIPNLENQTIILNSNPISNQHLYNLPSSSQVAAIFTEFEDQTLDKSAHIQEKLHATPSSKSKTKYQNFIFVDSKVYKKYLISIAEVRLITETFRYDGIDIQWEISTKTMVEELPDEESDMVQTGICLYQVPRFLAICRFNHSNNWMQPTVLSLWNELVENEGHILSQQVNKFPAVICLRLKVISYDESKCSSSKVRVCLASKFDTAESAENAEDASNPANVENSREHHSNDDESRKAKKAKLN